MLLHNNYEIQGHFHSQEQGFMEVFGQLSGHGLLRFHYFSLPLSSLLNVLNVVYFMYNNICHNSKSNALTENKFLKKINK